MTEKSNNNEKLSTTKKFYHQHEDPIATMDTRSRALVRLLCHLFLRYLGHSKISLIFGHQFLQASQFSCSLVDPFLLKIKKKKINLNKNDVIDRKKKDK